MLRARNDDRRPCTDQLLHRAVHSRSLPRQRRRRQPETRRVAGRHRHCDVTSGPTVDVRQRHERTDNSLRLTQQSVQTRYCELEVSVRIRRIVSLTISQYSCSQFQQLLTDFKNYLPAEYIVGSKFAMTEIFYQTQAVTCLMPRTVVE